MPVEIFEFLGTGIYYRIFGATKNVMRLLREAKLYGSDFRFYTGANLESYNLLAGFGSTK
jgi:hypothetical protein